MTDVHSHRDARRQAGMKLGFYIHLLAYIGVNLLLATINYSRNPQHLWFLYPLLGWGIGLFFHWFAVFVAPGLMRRFTDRELEKRRPGD